MYDMYGMHDPLRNTFTAIIQLKLIERSCSYRLNQFTNLIQKQFHPKSIKNDR